MPKVTGQAGAAKGAQIDLLLDRDDDTITICEIRYSDAPFLIDRKVARESREKLQVFEDVTKTKKKVLLAMVCAAGLRPTSYSEELVSGCVSLDALFG